MSPSYASASSVHLCVEDNSCILGFDDCDGDGDKVEEHNHVIWPSAEAQRCNLYGDPLMDLPQKSDDCFTSLLERECEHMPREDYPERLRSGALDLSIRSDAVDWIMKAHAHCNFGPLTAYLSVNYLDRFLSKYELPEGKAWMAQLLSVACLSLAAKAEETEVPSTLDLQVGEAKHVFEARTIRRMELLVLSTLKWKMQAVTPFSFIDFFLHQFNGGNVPTKMAFCQSIELMLTIIRGIEFLEFRSSEIASAISLLVLRDRPGVDDRTTVSWCSQEKVTRCYQVIQDKVLMRNRPHINDMSFSCMPQSPIGVLGASCLSFESDDHLATESLATSNPKSSAPKRRKISSC